MAFYLTMSKDWKLIGPRFMLSSLFVLIEILLFVDMVQGYYCEWNLCETDQYCCGDNQCCNNAYSLWYFWAGVIFLAIMLMSFGGFFRYCYGYRPQIIVHQITNFVPLPADIAYPEEMEGLVAYEDVEVASNQPNCEFLMKSPPPPYSEASTPVK